VFHGVKTSRDVHEFVTTRVLRNVRSRTFFFEFLGRACPRTDSIFFTHRPKELRLGNLPVTEKNLGRTCLKK
jgi:hypothetical protein